MAWARFAIFTTSFLPHHPPPGFTHTRRRTLFIPCSLSISRMSLATPALFLQTVFQLSICETKLTSAPKAKSCSCIFLSKIVSVTVKAFAWLLNPIINPTIIPIVSSSFLVIPIRFYVFIFDPAKVITSFEKRIQTCIIPLKTCNNTTTL